MEIREPSSFKTAPNYESPTDSGANNNGYVVKVRASDGELHDEQTITVIVTNVNEHPVFYIERCREHCIEECMKTRQE